jgi:hypothetical protein
MDDDRCYVELYFYDKLLSLKPSDISDVYVKHVWCIRFDSIRREICMILYDNLLPHSVNYFRHSANCSMHSFNCSSHSANCCIHSASCCMHSASGADTDPSGFIDLVQLGWIHDQLFQIKQSTRQLHFQRRKGRVTPCFS